MSTRDRGDGRQGEDPRPDLSVAIVNWNTRDLLHQCLSSLLGETEQIKCEVFVVDNASEDDSAHMVKELFPQVDLILNDENVGFAKAANQALELTRGRFVLLLNPDTQIVNGSLQTMIDFLDHCFRASIVCCQMLNRNGTIQPSFGRLPDLHSQFIYQSYLFKLIPSGLPVGSTPHRWQAKAYDTVHEVEWASGACLMFRREVLRTVGLLDESIFLYYEDADWCLRAARAGHRIYYLPQAQVVHDFGAAAKQDYATWIVNYTKGLWYFFQKHRGQGTSWCLAALLLMGSSLRWILWAILGLLNRARRREARQRRQGHRKAMAWLLRKLFAHTVSPDL